MKTRLLPLAAVMLALLSPAAGWAETPVRHVKIGVLSDLSGVFADYNGPGSVMAAKMAAEDFAGGGRGIEVEIVAGDHLNKPDIGSALARRWIDVEAVDAIVDVPNSAVGLAVNGLLRGTHAAFLATSTATSDLTGKDCSPNTVQWVTDTWSVAHATPAALLKQGGTSWFFITVDYALGQAIERDASAAIVADGGQVLGSLRHPLGTADFSSFLLQAQASKARVIGLANAGADTLNAVKQAAEFGIRDQGQTLVGFLMFFNDVHAMGLQVGQGLQFTEAFYWDMTDTTRTWSKRFAARMGGKMPSTNQAGVYSQTLAYLNAVAAVDSTDAKLVIARMKAAPIEDPLLGTVTVRPDGRAIHAMHLFRVKSPAASKYPFDYYELVQTIPAERAFRPLAEGGCPLVSK